MKSSLKSIWFLFGLAIFLSCANGENTKSSISNQNTKLSDPLFTYISSDISNVTFNNQLIEGLNTNILMYEYFYNGGGIASGDFDKNGYIDLYFTSNMGDNKMYLNQGDFVFKEVSTIAGVKGRKGPWKTGTTIVDVNGDGNLDLYVSYSGALPEAKRKNQLFVNKGNNADGIPSFKDEADSYGLGSPGFTNQAYFFDYDKDGDLDVAMLNHNPKNLPLLNESATKEMMKQDDPLRGLRLLRQEGGKFIDHTVKSGINGSSLSYGLGLGVGDFNNDGWQDMYVSNDYSVPDYVYINNGDGTFDNKIEKYIGHNSQFSMGNDIADVNNDGLSDIVTLDMLPEDNKRQKILMAPDNYAKYDLNVRSGFHHQHMRNMLQLNTGAEGFSEIGQFAGISNTDWSWAALAADLNNDAAKDLYITNGYLRDYTNMDFINYMESFVGNKGRLMREDVLEIIEKMPASNVANYIFENQKNGTFRNRIYDWGIAKPSNSNGAIYADLDNDGDIDLVTNNVNQEAFLLRNNSREKLNNNFIQIELKGRKSNTLGIGAKVVIVVKGTKQSLYQMPTRGYLSSVSPILHFGLAQDEMIDSLIVVWDNNMMEVKTNLEANTKIILEESNAKLQSNTNDPTFSIFGKVDRGIDYTHFQGKINDFDRQPLLTFSPSYIGPVMIKGDVNNDGLNDIFIGGGQGQAAKLFLKNKYGQFDVSPSSVFEIDKKYIDASATFVDINGDGYLDLFVGSGGYHSIKNNSDLLTSRIYINNKNGSFNKDEELADFRNVSSVLALDVNVDGLEDLLTLGGVVPGEYPNSNKNMLLINDGQGQLSEQTSKWFPALNSLQLVKEAVARDLNGDGIEEIILIGEWLPITIVEKIEDKYHVVTEKYINEPSNGWWNTINSADFNGDGQPDIVLGNLGLNSQLTASHKEPVQLFYGDFDRNGSVDPILTSYIQGDRFPFVTRDELLGQLPKLKSKFNTYESYASSKMNTIFTKKELEAAKTLMADELETSIFLSQPDGTYKKAILPNEVQYSPIHNILILDYNDDGNLDLLFCGNDLHAKLRLGKMDANFGMLCQGNGDGSFAYISQANSGLDLKGEIRSVLEDDGVVLFGINGSELVSYKFQSR